MLDRVHTLAAIEALEADPGAYAASLEVPADLETRDALLAGALRAIDDAIARVMKIRVDHVADALPVPTRRVFASTVLSYANDLPLLAERVRRAGGSDTIAASIVDAAQRTLALREALRAPVLAKVRELATAAIADADRNARDRKLDDVQRKRWSAVRRDLEMLAEEPARILAAPFAARLAAWPEQLDEPTEPEPTWADQIELD